MAETDKATITDTAQDIVSEMSLATGSYILQNKSRSRYVLVNYGASAAPDSADDYHEVVPLGALGDNSIGVTVDSTSDKVWVRTRFGTAPIVITGE